MMALNMQQAAQDMSGAVDYLRSLESVSGQSLGVVGFCMGGGLALLLAQQRPDAIRAAAPFYGVGPALGNVHAWTAANAAFQDHYAEHDDSAGPKVAQFFVYPGTHHAFFNDTRPDVYDAQTARLAWERTVRFFREQLA